MIKMFVLILALFLPSGLAFNVNDCAKTEGALMDCSEERDSMFEGEIQENFPVVRFTNVWILSCVESITFERHDGLVIYFDDSAETMCLAFPFADVFVNGTSCKVNKVQLRVRVGALF